MVVCRDKLDKLVDTLDTQGMFEDMLGRVESQDMVVHLDIWDIQDKLADMVDTFEHRDLDKHPDNYSQGIADKPDSGLELSIPWAK